MGYLPPELFPQGFGRKLSVTPIKPVPPVEPDPDPEHPKPKPQPPIPPPPSIDDPPTPGTGNTPVYTPPSEKPAAHGRPWHPVTRYFRGSPSLRG